MQGLGTRHPGLHAVIDIGASTLDVCGIELLAKDGEDAYELLTADVRDFGFLELHSRRMGVAGHKPPFDAVPNDLVAPFVGLAADFPTIFARGWSGAIASTSKPPQPWSFERSHGCVSAVRLGRRRGVKGYHSS